MEHDPSKAYSTHPQTIKFKAMMPWVEEGHSKGFISTRQAVELLGYNYDDVVADMAREEALCKQYGIKLYDDCGHHDDDEYAQAVDDISEGIIRKVTTPEEQ